MLDENTVNRQELLRDEIKELEDFYPYSNVR